MAEGRGALTFCRSFSSSLNFERLIGNCWNCSFFRLLKGPWKNEGEKMESSGSNFKAFKEDIPRPRRSPSRLTSNQCLRLARLFLVILFCVFTAETIQTSSAGECSWVCKLSFVIHGEKNKLGRGVGILNYLWTFKQCKQTVHSLLFV
jgi:hypothetical protein